MMVYSEMFSACRLLFNLITYDLVFQGCLPRLSSLHGSSHLKSWKEGKGVYKHPSSP